MKINDKGSVDPKLIQGQSVDKTGSKKSQKNVPPKTAEEKTATGAKVSLSSNAQDIQKAKAVAMGAEDVNMDKVAKIKQAIADGTYKMDDDKIADSMLEHEVTYDLF
jgi:flagellar biosynthesis anti-sigma factor FlgM